MLTRRDAMAGGAALGLHALAMPWAAAQPARATTAQRSGSLLVDEVARGLEHPWAVAFLPDGRFLVTERPGRLRIVNPGGSVSGPLANLPEVVARNQGGLLDLCLDPDFASNRTLFFTFAEPRQNGNGTAVARARLSADTRRLEDVTVIFRQMPSARGGFHFGSRIVPDRTGHLWVALGDRYGLRDEAQNPANHIGKIVRIGKDGTAPADNPRLPGWAPELWSIGHRNVQGATAHPVTGKLWTAEHGARGGDEINIPEAGRNYGWPIITYGVDYSGARIGEGQRKPGLEQPIYYWDPSIAPSGMTFLTSDRYPGWRGSLFVGGLAGQLVARLTVEGEQVTGEERLLTDLRARIRDVRQGPDGWLYLLVDAPAPDGRLLRLRPA